MSIHQLAAALQVLHNAITTSIPRGAAAALLEVMASCCALLAKLSEALRGIEDPRVAAAHAHLLEQLFHDIQREQLRSQIHLESTGAHLLEDDELDALRRAREQHAYRQLDLVTAPRMHAGRSHYTSTADFAAAWLGLNYYGAASRLHDAHLLIARRAMDGGTLTPRLAGLARLYQAPGAVDPRRIAQAARALDKFEPADTCFEGLPLPPTARHADGALMEEHVLAALAEPNRTTSEKQVSTLISDYRREHGKQRAPETGIFFRGTRAGVDCYDLRAAGEQAEQLRSLMGQADNPRTQAGKAARAARPGSSNPGRSAAEAADQDEVQTDPLFSSDAPAPDWSGINSGPDSSPDAGPVPDGGTGGGPAEEGRENLIDFDTWHSAGKGSQGASEGQYGQDISESQHAQESSEGQEGQDSGGAETGHEDAGHGFGDAAGQPRTEYSDQDPELGGDADVPPAQRRLNAFLAALGSGFSGPGAKTIAPRVGIHIQLKALEDLRHPEMLTSTTDHGVGLDAAETGRLMCEGAIYRVIFGPDGQPLDVGRTQRFFTEAIKRAALARDRGCIVPGCTAPPEMLECHHDDWWEHGGRTSCRNASCLCRRHHLAIHAGLLTLVKIGGLAYILFPKHVDPLQIPQRNRLYTAA
ncbi:HNH endonuclease signature motif containing protein [Glutamicibacter soli]